MLIVAVGDVKPGAGADNDGVAVKAMRATPVNIAIFVLLSFANIIH